MTENLKYRMLEKLARGKMWGGKHTPLNLLIRGLPDEFRNTQQGKKAIQKALKELIYAEFIIATMKMTGNSPDKHLSLNPRKMGEIQQIIATNEQQSI